MIHKVISGYFATLIGSYTLGFTKGVYHEQKRINFLLKNKITDVKLVQNHYSVGNEIGSRWLSETFLFPFWIISSPVWLPIHSIQKNNKKVYDKLR
tara:strand:+ start:452 stop:739 length:288 start_codon:yes stop_codon:yes gene_type:complete